MLPERQGYLLNIFSGKEKRPSHHIMMCLSQKTIYCCKARLQIRKRRATDINFRNVKQKRFCPYKFVSFFVFSNCPPYIVATKEHRIVHVIRCKVTFGILCAKKEVNKDFVKKKTIKLNTYNFIKFR